MRSLIFRCLSGLVLTAGIQECQHHDKRASQSVNAPHTIPVNQSTPMIQIILSPILARLLHQTGTSEQPPGDTGRAYEPLFSFLTRIQCQLVPVFPGSQDESMFPYFMLVSTKPVSNTTLQQLQTMPGVDGAYRKPADEAP